MEKEPDQIINKVTNSKLVTFDLEEYFQPGVRVLLDIREQLYQDLIIKEKDFREFIKQHDWTQYQGKFVAVHCSVDVIIPTWAFMLLAIALQPFAQRVIYGTLDDLETDLFKESLQRVDWSQFTEAKVVIKGCSKVDVPVAVYVEAAMKLKPFAASMMFGEPCSTVPLWKKAKAGIG